MPKYRNITDAPADLPGYGQVPAGMACTTNRNQYVWPLPAAFEIEEDSPSPIETLWDGPIAATILSGLLPYVQFTVQNDSGAVLSVYLNGTRTTC